MNPSPLVPPWLRAGALLLLLVLAGCGNAPREPPAHEDELAAGAASRDSIPRYTADFLRAVATEVTIDGRRYTLGGFLSRDFMPVADAPVGGPVWAWLDLNARDRREVPLRCGAVWLVYGDSAVATRLLSVDPAVSSGGHGLFIRAMSEAYWPVGAKGVAVVELRDRVNRTYLLRSDSLTIIQLE